MKTNNFILLLILGSIFMLISSCSEYADLTKVENKNGLLTHGDWVQKTNIPPSEKFVFVDERFGDVGLTTNFIIIKAKKINYESTSGCSDCSEGSLVRKFTYSNNKYYFIVRKVTGKEEELNYPDEAVFLISKEKIFSHQNNKRIFLRKVKHFYLQSV
jgi:hypothetical protein